MKTSWKKCWWSRQRKTIQRKRWQEKEERGGETKASTVDWDKKSSGWGPMGIQDPIFLQQPWGARSYGCCWCTCSYCPFCCWIKFVTPFRWHRPQQPQWQNQTSKQSAKHSSCSKLAVLQHYSQNTTVKQSSPHNVISSQKSEHPKSRGFFPFKFVSSKQQHVQPTNKRFTSEPKADTGVNSNSRKQFHSKFQE